MNAVVEALEALSAALRGVQGLRVTQDPGASIDPPAAILGPPTLTWSGHPGLGPTDAKFAVHIVVKSDARAAGRLLDLIPLITEAVENDTDGVVLTATPGSYALAGTALPAYLLTIEVPL